MVTKNCPTCHVAHLVGARLWLAGVDQFLQRWSPDTFAHHSCSFNHFLSARRRFRSISSDRRVEPRLHRWLLHHNNITRRRSHRTQTIKLFSGLLRVRLLGCSGRFGWCVSGSVTPAFRVSLSCKRFFSSGRFRSRCLSSGVLQVGHMKIGPACRVVKQLSQSKCPSPQS